MNKITINPEYTKTYKTVKNLERALSKLGLPDGFRYLECWSENGRVTAVFINVTAVENGVYLSHIASNGFKVVAQGDNPMTDSTRLWWNDLSNKKKISVSRKIGWSDTFRMWGQLESWEQNALISYWLKG